MKIVILPVVGTLRWRSSKAARLLSRYKPRGIPHSLNKAELETYLDQTSPNTSSSSWISRTSSLTARLSSRYILLSSPATISARRLCRRQPKSLRSHCPQSHLSLRVPMVLSTQLVSTSQVYYNPKTSSLTLYLPRTPTSFTISR